MICSYLSADQIKKEISMRNIYTGAIKMSLLYYEYYYYQYFFLKYTVYFQSHNRGEKNDVKNVNDSVFSPPPHPRKV